VGLGSGPALEECKQALSVSTGGNSSGASGSDNSGGSGRSSSPRRIASR